MNRFIMVSLLLCSLSFGLADGESLRNNAGEHVLIAPTDSTGTSIKWLKVTSEGYLQTVSVSSASSALSLGFAEVVVGLSDSSFVQGNTLLNFFVKNPSVNDTVYVSLDGTTFLPLFPREGLSVSSIAIDTLHLKASSISTSVFLMYSY